MAILSVIMQGKNSKKNSRVNSFYSDVRLKITRPAQTISLHSNDLHRTHYTWLIFLVNLQLFVHIPYSLFNYTWLIFLVNLQPLIIKNGHLRDYTWLIFLVNLQLYIRKTFFGINYTWLIFLVNLQPRVENMVKHWDYTWLIFLVNLQLTASFTVS